MALRPLQRALSALIVLAMPALLAPSALAAVGDLDPDFGDNGSVVVRPSGNTTGYTDVAIQPDGKIVLAGYWFAGAGDTDMAVTRLNPDGSLDLGFGVGGSAFINVSANPFNRSDVANAVALQPDGKIVVAGYSPSGSTTLATVARLTPGGQLDLSFSAGDANDPDGIAQVRLGSANDVAVDLTGKIVIAGTWTASGGNQTDSFVARLNSNGSDDPGGSKVWDLGGNDGVNRLALTPDNRVVSAGYYVDLGMVTKVSGLDFDDTFSGNGIFTYNLGAGAGASAQDVLIQPDGKIDLATSGGPGSNMAVTRLTATGDLDPSLDGQSSVQVDFGGDDSASAIARLASGKLLLAGTSENRFAVARLQPGGTPDETFGPGGKRTFSPPGGNAEATAMAVQPDGKIVLVGNIGLGGGVIRLQGDTAAAGGGPGDTGGPGGGTKVTRCLGKRATIVGTNGRNTLRGTRRADVIVGLGGNDKISGLGGNDVVCAGSGNDSVAGGDGNDKVSGGTGNDKVAGGKGNDSLAGDSGKDSLSGDAGKDKESGGPGNDRVLGGPGNDSLLGGAGKDLINGNGGRDGVNGGGGKDRCAGRDSKTSC